MCKSAFEEFRETGEVGPEYLALIARAFHAVIRRRGIPSPSRNSSWTPDEVDDAVQDFLAERGMERLAQLYIEAVDDESLRRLVQTAVRRFLADRSRGTQRGRLIRRFRRDLDDSPLFRLISGGGEPQWALADGPDHAASFNVDRLVRVAWRLDLKVTQWNDEAARQGPPADRASRLLLLETTLREAGGSLTVPELAAVAERRFVLNADPQEVSFDELEDFQAPAVTGVDVDVDSSQEARRIWGALSARQWSVLPYLHLSAREAAAAMGLGHSSVHAAQQQVRAVLVEVLGPNPDMGVVRELAAIIEDSVRNGEDRPERTSEGDSPSQPDPRDDAEDGARG